MNKESYYWNDKTISHFTFMSNYISEEEVKQEIQEFVEFNCYWEDESEITPMVNSLINKVF